MRPRSTSTLPALAVACCLLALATGGCSGGEPGGPEDRQPTITVSGVQNGETLRGPATITISVDVGTYSATLNGVTWLGGPVSEPGSYVLTITARNGPATAKLELTFQIALASESVLIVRLFDLGSNDAGGGGDAMLLTDSSPAGSRHILVDAGPAGVGGRDASFVNRRLAILGVDTLVAMILTHAHSDHFDGMSAILQDVVVQRFFYNGQVRNFSRYTNTIALANARAGQVTVPTAVAELALGLGATPTSLAVVPPLTSFLNNPNAGSSELNDGSIGTEVTKGPFRMFLTGDGEIRANLRWRQQFSPQTANVDVLKLGHHGANDAMFDNGFNVPSTWLSHADPEVAVISANGTTHPRQNAIAHALSLGSMRTYCTNVHGDIEIRVGDGGAFFVTVERNDGTDCVAGSEAST